MPVLREHRAHERVNHANDGFVVGLALSLKLFDNFVDRRSPPDMFLWVIGGICQREPDRFMDLRGASTLGVAMFVPPCCARLG